MSKFKLPSKEETTVKVRKTFPMFLIMFLIMFALKLAEIGVMKDASWWLVTSPLWGPIALVLALLLAAAVVLGTIFAIAKIIEGVIEKRKYEKRRTN